MWYDINMNMRNYNGFILQSDNKDSKESLAVVYSASYYKIPVRVIKNPQDVPNNWVAVGSVEWLNIIFNVHLMDILTIIY